MEPNPYRDNGARYMLFNFFVQQLERNKTGDQAFDNAVDYWVEELGGNPVDVHLVEDVYDECFVDLFTEGD